MRAERFQKAEWWRQREFSGKTHRSPRWTNWSAGQARKLPFPSSTLTSEMTIQISIQRSSSGLLLNYISPQFVHSDHQVGLPWAHHWSVPGGSQVRSCAWSPVKFNCVLSELHDEKPSDEMVTESFFNQLLKESKGTSFLYSPVIWKHQCIWHWRRRRSVPHTVQVNISFRSPLLTAEWVSGFGEA